jgi:hypothetical protein
MKAPPGEIEWQVACDFIIAKVCHEIRSNAGYYGAGRQFIAGRPFITASDTRALSLPHHSSHAQAIADVQARGPGALL